MKKIVILFTLVSLVLLIPVKAFGAIHNFGDGYAATDTWYTITPDQPYIEAHYRNAGYTVPETLLGAEYFQNDQTFVDLNVYMQDEDNKTYIDGSYLFSFGLFAGLNLYSHTYPGYSFQDLTISPGYRLALDKQSYVAVSLDYYSSETLTDILDYEVNARYYNDKMKVTGNLVSYTKPSYGINYISVGINYQVADAVVVGGSFGSTETLKLFMAGCTFQSDLVIVDGQLTNSSNSAGNSTNTFDVSGMFRLGENFKLGAEYYKSSDVANGALVLKANLAMEKSGFTLKIMPENDTYASSASLAYECQL